MQAARDEAAEDSAKKPPCEFIPVVSTVSKVSSSIVAHVLYCVCKDIQRSTHVLYVLASLSRSHNCQKQGPRVGALHRLRPRRSSERYQCTFSTALGADAGTASHRPSQQLICDLPR